MKSRFFAIFLFMFLARNLLADDLDDFDRFEPPKIEIEEKKQNILSGSLLIQGAYQFNDQNAADHIRRARSRGDLNVKAPISRDIFFKAEARAIYEGAKDAAAKSGAELNEAFVQARLGENADIKIGRQLIVWGKSDMLRVTDLINPLDSREPGMTDMPDLRLGITAARADYFAGNWDIQVVAIAERRFSQRAEYPSEFMPRKPIEPDEPRGFQGAISALGSFEGFDLAFHCASLFRDDPASRERANMAGFSLAKAVENWVLRAEAAAFRGEGGDFGRRDYLAGFEYSGFSDLSAALEIVTREGDGDRSESAAARLSYDLFNARLKLTMLAIGEKDGGANGAIARFQGDYEIENDLFFSAGLVFYGGRLIGVFDQNDRAFAGIKANF